MTETLLAMHYSRFTDEKRPDDKIGELQAITTCQVGGYSIEVFDILRFGRGGCDPSNAATPLPTRLIRCWENLQELIAARSSSLGTQISLQIARDIDVLSFHAADILWFLWVIFVRNVTCKLKIC
jgi:hypothetical protein